MSSTTTALVASTPKAVTPAPKATLPPPSPGTWRHPKFTEIVQRQSASTFSDRSLRVVTINSIALITSFILSSALHSSLDKVSGFIDLPLSSTAASCTPSLLRLYFLANIFLALRPLLPYFNNADEVNDIPLTPSQRALLGLPPSNTSTPTSALSVGYITPPRYRRSSGSFSGSPLSSANSGSTTDRRSISANYASSPLSTSRQTLGFSPSPSPFRTTTRTASGSPLSYSPSASPLLQRAVTRGEPKEVSPLTSGRQSFGANTSGLGLSRSQSVRERGMKGGRDSEPGTPSPTTGAKRNTGLNYKWMYEKGRKLPKSDSMQF